MFNLFGLFSAGLSLLFIVFLELIVVAWIYGEWRSVVVKTFYSGQCLKNVLRADSFGLGRICCFWKHEVDK